MKSIQTLTISILLLACGTTPSQNDEQSKQVDENWEMASHTLTTNTYTTNGLLDTSFETMYAYEMGTTYKIKSIIVRRYKNNKLTDEKEFTLEDDGSKTLANETINQYDVKGNLIKEVHLSDANLLTKKTNTYNNKRQVIKSVLVFKKISHNLNDYILDSVIAHRNDKKHFQYDTTINTYEYDSKGNQTRVLDAKGTIQETTFTQYSGNAETFSFSLSPQGDTTSKMVFQKDGKLVKQISYIKETNTVDTIWLDNDKIVKMIGHNGNRKHKDVTIYNDKGDEIESTSYK